MRRRRRGSGDEITLFPFLAVLICTMGSLIVLLVVVVQQAKASATTAAERADQQKTQHQEDVASLQIEVEDLQWRIEMLAGSRDRTKEQLERQQQELSYLEDEIRQLRGRLFRAAAEAEDIEEQAGSEQSERENAEAKVAQLREQLDYAKEALAQARQEFKTAEPAYSIVPYKGPNGTRRRPLYVECKSDRIILQPEGIELFSEDFEEPITDNNPLAAALRAQSEYLSDATAGERPEPPYPLLLIRPDGAKSYAAARAAMKSWDSEFGYELVEEDLKLAYPPRDEGLAAAIREAVEEARARREILQKMAPARFGRRGGAGNGPGNGSGGGTLRASPSGGFVAQRGSDQSANRRAASNGFGPANHPTGPGQTALGQTGQGSFHGNPAPNPFLPGQGSNPFERTETAEGSGRGRGTSGNGLADWNAPRDPSRSSRQNQSNAYGNDRYSESNSATDRTGQGPAGREPGAEGTASGAASRSNQQGIANSPSNGGQPVAGNATGSRETSPADGSGSAAAATAGGSQAGSAGSAATAGGSGAGNPFGSPAAPPQSIARQRGLDWGLPNGGSGSTGITRPISIQLTEDRLLMVSEDRRVSKPTFVLEVEESLRDDMDSLVTAIWKRMDGWGIAGYRMHWKPVLQVDVGPSAETRYEELVRLLEDSGIVVQRK